MNERTTTARTPLPVTIIAAVGLGIAVASAIGAVALRRIDPVPLLPSRFGFGDIALVGFEVMGVAFASVGALLVVRRPRNAVGWCLLLVGVGYAGGGFFAAVASSAAALGTDSGRQLAGATGWLTLLLTTIGGLVFALPFIFPTGRGHTPRWDRAIRWSVVPGTFTLLLLLFQPGELHVFTTLRNPLGIGPDLRPIIGLTFSEVVPLLACVFVPVVAFAIVTRYRASNRAEQQQLKWFLVAMFISIAGIGLGLAGAALSKEPPGEIGLAVFGFAGALVPVAIGIAILRHGLYDIDRIISRTLGYAVVTGLLAVVFVGVILLLGRVPAALAQGLIPDEQWTSIGVAISTLVAFALFQPVRRRVQRAVDRRYDRARYDADRTVRAFSSRLRYDVDLAAVSQEIVDTATTAVRPTSVTLWLRARSASPR
jgi:hypothetical protein